MSSVLPNLPARVSLAGSGAGLDWSAAGGGAAPSGGGGVGGFLHYLFHNPVTHYAGKTIEGLANDAINLPAGLWTGGGMLIHHPEEFGKLMYHSTLESFEHPGRHPDQTLLNILGLAPLPISIAARGADIAGIVARGGELPAELTEAAAREAAAAKGLSEPLSGLKYAESIGQGDRYSRIVDPLTGVVRQPGKQIRDTLLHGIADEERLLFSPTGEARHGWMYSKNPGIKAAQKMVDAMYLRFPDNAPPPLWRIVPGFQRTKVGRLQSAAKAAQTIERNSAAKNIAVFQKKWGRITDLEGMAARLVGEMRNPDGSINLHEAELRADHPDLNVGETQEQIRLINEVKDRGWLDYKTITLPSSGRSFRVPVLSDQAPAHLHEFIEDARKISNEQQDALHLSSVLPEESLLNRLLAPFHQVNFGGRLPPSIAKLEKRLNQLRNLKGTEAERVRVEEQLTDLRAQWEEAQKAPPPEATVTEPEAPVPPPEPSFAERKLQQEAERLRAEGASGSEARLKEIEAHVERIKKNELGDKLEEVPHDMTVQEMRELRSAGNPFYVPYKIHKVGKQGFGFTGFRKAFRLTNRATPPSRITHAMGARKIGEDERTLLKQGGGRTDVHKLIAENYTEGMRYVTLMRHYKDILASAQDTPEGIPPEHAQLIRDLTNLPSGVMPRENAEAYARVARNLRDGTVDPNMVEGNASLFEGIRNWIFPDHGEDFRPVPGYKWVDDRTLGYLNKRNPLWSAFESPIVRKVVKSADVINSIQKSMILYLKPAYAFPNAFGNLFLNAIQQGVFAPLNLARSFRVFSRLHPETVAKMDTLMGGGFTEVLKSPGIAGATHRIQNLFATGYGKVVDVPFRRASFLHEARRSGFSTNAELERLLSDPALADQAERIASRANEEILNYERMGPGEQAVLRRLVFFYPWLKASTRYASYLAKNHPLVAGSTGNLGQLGEERIQRILGDLPSFDEGLIPYTSSHGGMPLTGNPSSFAFLQEPADLAKMLLNVVERNPNLDLNAFTNLAPFDKGLMALLSAGKLTSQPYPASMPILERAALETFGGNPLVGNPSALLEQLTGGPSYPGSIHPSNDWRTAALKFAVLGALTPQPTNVGALNWKAWQQNNPSGYEGG